MDHGQKTREGEIREIKPPRVSMLLVALTGGIATGKSVVARVLKEKGCYLHSADRVAHRLMKPGRPAWHQIVAHFGPEILHADGTVNRSKLGEIIFSRRKERLFLNRLIHPLVLKKKAETVRRLERSGRYQIFVSEAALTIEAGFQGFFDKIVVVTCEPSIQLQRLVDRDGLSPRQALKKIRGQMTSTEKLKYADYIVDTTGPLEDTVAKSEKLFRCLRKDYRDKNRHRRPQKALALQIKREAAKRGIMIS